MTETPIANSPAPAGSLRRLISCVRFDEVLVLQGPPLIGAILALDALTGRNVVLLAVLALGSLCLVAHVFVLNDWSGIYGDLEDPRRAARTFATKGIGRTKIGLLALALLGLSLAFFALLGAVPLLLALAIAGLGGLYSAPATHVKGIPVLGSFLHLLGGTLHFLLGYATFAAIDGRGIAIGCFFGLVFAAGHLMHETRDHAADLLNGIRTNAVVFGRTRTFFAGFALFTVAYALLATLAALGIVPRLLVLMAALYPIHLWATIRALRAGLTFEGLRQLQACYRLLYTIIGVTMVAAALLP